MANNLIYLEGILEIRGNQEGFEVVFSDGQEITVEKECVESIINLLGSLRITEEEIASFVGILRNIENSNATDEEVPIPIREKVFFNVTAKLLSTYSLDELFCYVKDKKWHEIVQIYYSKKPTVTITD